MQLIINEFTKNHDGSFHFVDVTNDGQPDLIFIGFLLFSDTFYVMSCNNGQYVVFSGQNNLGIGNTRGQTIYEIIDMNKNGIPEIVVYAGSCTGGGCYHFFIGEWNGQTFVDLGRQPREDSIYLDGLYESEISIDDLNKDGFLDLKLTGGLYDRSFPRWRKETYIYAWDGTYFSQLSVEYAPPVYRFQAVQDADRAVLQHQNEKAFKLYQNVISSRSLKDYSPAIAENIADRFDAFWLRTPTPTIPPIDPAEYPILAAYASYRIMILQAQLGEMDEAQTQYAALQTKFPAGNTGHLYVEIATAFWDSYQSTKTMYNACAAAIAYADAHPEILTPLGSDYHGSQSYIYTPADVCPFR